MDNNIISFSLPDVEELRLPSNGIGSQQLVSLKIRPMTWNEERFLTNKTLIKQGKVQEAIFKSVVVGGTTAAGVEVTKIDLDELLAEDEYALLLFIRAISYGRDYETKLTCPNCSEEQEIKLDIEKDLPVKYANSDMKPFITVKLPIQKKTVVMRMPRHKDTSDNIHEMIPKLIISVEGIDDILVPTWIQTIVALDASTLRKEYQKSDFGVEKKIKFSCGNAECDSFKTEIEAELPITSDFFRI
jgi:hypothetical protein